jgi:hypothetical protein
LRTDPFKQFEGWNDTDWIKAEVEKAFAKGAHVAVKTLRRALRRLVADGYHGPIGDRDWEDMAGYRMSVARALDIVKRAQSANLPTVRLDDPDVGLACRGVEDCEHPDHAELNDDGRLFHTEPVEVDQNALVDWYFAELMPIYGMARM